MIFPSIVTPVFFSAIQPPCVKDYIPAAPVTEWQNPLAFLVIAIVYNSPEYKLAGRSVYGGVTGGGLVVTGCRFNGAGYRELKTVVMFSPGR